jgi:hypothetical protein
MIIDSTSTAIGKTMSADGAAVVSTTAARMIIDGRLERRAYGSRRIG